MSTVVRGRQSRQSGRPRAGADDLDGRSAGQVCRNEQPPVLANAARAIAAIEAAGRVESDLASTLHAAAAQSRGEAAIRRLRLAEDADRGAQAAARISDRLQQHAHQWAEDADVAALRVALVHTATLLADLAHAETSIAAILTNLAIRDGPQPAKQRLAATASAAAQHARDLAKALHGLARAGAAGTSPEAAGAGPEPVRPRRESAASMRLADIDRRRAERQPARPAASGNGQAPSAGRDAQRRAQQARQRWQESVVHLLQARQLTEVSFRRAASAHDGAAEANARSARAGIGDVAEHSRRAALHRAAADADRQQAQHIHAQAADSAPQKATGIPS